MTSAAPLIGTNTDRGAVPAAGDEATDRGDRLDLHALVGSPPTGRPRCLRLVRLGWSVLLVRAWNHPAAPAMSPRCASHVTPLRQPCHPERSEGSSMRISEASSLRSE
ncbi:hypothetical protein EYB53_022550 [Candidatus Chloroploca sp. M-50]|uniref:Uncharacterized protein n=1 Tax=Candidatus Chloroploca mongolica TaxID=2528176 RepID=A0ABS4DGF5_9CHLR|nr:hypothetical protein [Candidatus Chloroploca mongolica]MBP1468510.1 hypothetical protein [Candidatus Chloroploca mongolica]